MGEEVEEQDEPAVEHHDWTGRPVPRRTNRAWRLLERVPIVWKALGVVVAIFLAGVTATSYINAKSEAYVLRSSYDSEEAAAAADRSSMHEQIRLLQASDAATDASIRAIEADTASMRDDVRHLLDSMLANPPPRYGGGKVSGRQP
jgi:sensor c-di-GMP phosphodiesterase-like protein